MQNSVENMSKFVEENRGKENRVEICGRLQKENEICRIMQEFVECDVVIYLITLFELRI